MRTCCIAQGTLLHFVVQQKLTQHCKTTIPQFKKKSVLVRKQTGLSGEIYGEKTFYQRIGLTGAHWKENRKSNQKTDHFFRLIIFLKKMNWGESYIVSSSL